MTITILLDKNKTDRRILLWTGCLNMDDAWYDVDKTSPNNRYSKSYVMYTIFIKNKSKFNYI